MDKKSTLETTGAMMVAGFANAAEIAVANRAVENICAESGCSREFALSVLTSLHLCLDTQDAYYAVKKRGVEALIKGLAQPVVKAVDSWIGTTYGAETSIFASEEVAKNMSNFELLATVEEYHKNKREESFNARYSRFVSFCNSMGGSSKNKGKNNKFGATAGEGVVRPKNSKGNMATFEGKPLYAEQTYADTMKFNTVGNPEGWPSGLYSRAMNSKGEVVAYEGLRREGGAQAWLDSDYRYKVGPKKVMRVGNRRALHEGLTTQQELHEARKRRNFIEATPDNPEVMPHMPGNDILLGDVFGKDKIDVTVSVTATDLPVGHTLDVKVTANPPVATAEEQAPAGEVYPKKAKRGYVDNKIQNGAFCTYCGTGVKSSQIKPYTSILDEGVDPRVVEALRENQLWLDSEMCGACRRALDNKKNHLVSLGRSLRIAEDKVLDEEATKETLDAEIAKLLQDIADNESAVENMKKIKSPENVIGVVQANLAAFKTNLVGKQHSLTELQESITGKYSGIATMEAALRGEDIVTTEEKEVAGPPNPNHAKIISTPNQGANPNAAAFNTVGQALQQAKQNPNRNAKKNNKNNKNKYQNIRK